VFGHGEGHPGLPSYKLTVLYFESTDEWINRKIMFHIAKMLLKVGNLRRTLERKAEK
jgi:hypothetical protein